MICFNRYFLTTIGVTNGELDEYDAHGDGRGIAISPLFSFGGGGNVGRDTATLEAEAPPRRLMLVGMADRYHEGDKRSTEVQSLCVDANGGGHRTPTSEEVAVIAAALETCAHPSAPTIRTRLLTFGVPVSGAGA